MFIDGHFYLHSFLHEVADNPHGFSILTEDLLLSSETSRLRRFALSDCSRLQVLCF